MDHVKSVLKMTVKDGEVKGYVKEYYESNSGAKADKKFPLSEYSINNENVDEHVVENARSWIRGDWIEEEAME